MERIQRTLATLDEITTTAPRRRYEHGPWSQHDYVRRARSIHWSWPVPAPADATGCALRGWHQPADVASTLHCYACRAQLYLPWDDELVPEARQLLAEEYGERLTSAHAEGCPWRITPCQRHVMRAAFAGRAMELKACQERCQSWAGLGGISVCVNEPALEALLQAARSQFPTDVHTGVLLLSLLHWTRIDDSVACVHGCCEVPLECLRSEFDPIAAHAWFCPLVYKSDGDDAAWRELIQLYGTATNNQPSDVEGLSPLLSQFTRSRIREVLWANRS